MKVSQLIEILESDFKPDDKIVVFTHDRTGQSHLIDLTSISKYQNTAQPNAEDDSIVSE